jgi:group I intron endonuclease
MFYIVYKTTNQVNGKFYIGTHKTVDLNDGYLGSGALLKRAIKKYGIENFKKEILFVFDNPEDMFAKEAEIVTEEFLSENNTYNLKKGGFGGWDYNNIPSADRIKKNQLARINANKIIKQKYSVTNPGQLPQTRRAASATLKKRHSEGKVRYDTFRGKKHSQKTKDIIGRKNSMHQIGVGNSQYGTMWIYSLTEKKSIKIKKTQCIPEGWNQGRKIKFDL